MTAVTILGATGTIGTNTLAVIRQHRPRYKVFALTANTAVDALYELCLEWSPRYAVMADENAAEQLRQQLKPINTDIEVLWGSAGLCQVASAAITIPTSAALATWHNPALPHSTSMSVLIGFNC